MKKILETALTHVTGDRAATHGPFIETHENIAALWGAYLGVPLTGKDAALMLALLKIARTKNGAHNPDDYVDLAGYAALAGTIAEEKNDGASLFILGGYPARPVAVGKFQPKGDGVQGQWGHNDHPGIYGPLASLAENH